MFSTRSPPTPSPVAHPRHHSPESESSPGVGFYPRRFRAPFPRPFPHLDTHASSSKPETSLTPNDEMETTDRPNKHHARASHVPNARVRITLLPRDPRTRRRRSFRRRLKPSSTERASDTNGWFAIESKLFTHTNTRQIHKEKGCGFDPEDRGPRTEDGWTKMLGGLEEENTTRDVKDAKVNAVRCGGLRVYGSSPSV